MTREDDRTPEQKQTHRWAVVGRDSFLSGWGGAKGGYSREEIRAMTMIEKTNEAARKVWDRMEMLHLDAICVDGVGNIDRRWVKSNVGCERVLSLDGGGDLMAVDIATESDSGCYLHGDFSCWVSDPTREDVMCFANGIEAIDAALDVVSREQDSEEAKACEKLDKYL